jgi:hypothetical protein
MAFLLLRRWLVLVHVLLAGTKCTTSELLLSSNSTNASFDLVGEICSDLTSLLGEYLVTENLFVARSHLVASSHLVVIILHPCLLYHCSRAFLRSCRSVGAFSTDLLR